MYLEDWCVFDGVRPRGFSAKHSCHRAWCEDSGRNAYCRSANDQRRYLAKLAGTEISSSDLEWLRPRQRGKKRKVCRVARMDLLEEPDTQHCDWWWYQDFAQDSAGEEGADYVEKTDSWDCNWSMASTTASFEASDACSSISGAMDNEDQASCSSIWPRRSTGKLRPWRWEKAQAIAADRTAAYMQINGLQMGPAPRRRCERSRTAREAVNKPLHSSMATPCHQYGGAPPCPHRHGVVARFVEHKARSQKNPAFIGFGCVRRGIQQPKMHLVDPANAEYAAVSDYFLFTVQKNGCEVVDLTRLQNTSTYSRYRRTCAPSGRPETIMFHGCRTKANEDSIIANGFQVSKCVSGGSNYGTWLAYGANYSNDGGFIYREKSGIKHIFVCAVNYCSVKKDDATMRVVGQDCACPIWLLRYRDYSGGWNRKNGKHCIPAVFYQVVDGEWKAVFSESSQR